MLGRNELFRLIAIVACLIVASTATIQAEESNNTQPNMMGMSSAMQKSMDPNVMMKMMNMMMDPEKAMSMESCAECHDAETVARYAKDYGPMMESMKPMMSMMNPQMMNSMMAPMMGMMAPMMGMMNPMMGMMNPMMGSMMNPMAMMGPMMGMGGMSSMMNPMAMMGPMMGMGGMSSMMNPMTMMNPMMGGMGMPGAQSGNPMGQMPGGQMMDPKQYEQWFSQWTEMMNNMTQHPQTNQ